MVQRPIHSNTSTIKNRLKIDKSSWVNREERCAVVVVDVVTELLGSLATISLRSAKITLANSVIKVIPRFANWSQ